MGSTLDSSSKEEDLGDEHALVFVLCEDDSAWPVEVLGAKVAPLGESMPESLGESSLRHFSLDTTAAEEDEDVVTGVDEMGHVVISPLFLFLVVIVIVAAEVPLLTVNAFINTLPLTLRS